ncbi:putative cytochrome P450 monooxygenase [Kickxella alabastrina]|uniref:putative cytochrome P450 monooxygenase n=1 Tax=Kickxella alabastrina TaxID=61397 RepID=UPI00221E9788|nr:putative cytochrome P450 monooxygenase [Kickxella alabastrina]KAI7826728.1 putative cytochrome P450 monooxygenase [Kickxella alabastrina]
MSLVPAFLANPLWELLQPLNILCGLVAYFCWKLIYALYFSPLRNVPGSIWPRITSLALFFYEVRGLEPEFIKFHNKKYGGIFVMTPSRVAICDPEDSQIILGTHAFLKDKRYSNIEIMEPNMFLTVDPELNKQRRRQMGPSMSVANLKLMEPAILEAGPKQLFNKWDRDIEQSADGLTARVSYYNDLMLMAFDIVGSLGFGQTHRSLTSGDTQIVKWVHSTFMLIFLQSVMPLVKTTLFRQFIAKSFYDKFDAFHTLCARAVSERKKLLSGLQPNENKPKDILQSYIDAEDPESRIRMTSSQVVAETILNMLAGSDTTSNTMVWTIHLLLMHPHYYSRVVEEVRAVFDRDHIISYSEAKTSLPFLEACIYESLRLAPVATTMPRFISPGGATLHGHFIPEGYNCTVSITGVNTNPEVWERSYEFYPERFLDNEANRRIVLTFSAGVRVCPGKNLAWIEMQSTLANIFNRYNLEIPADSLFTPDRVDNNGLPIVMPRIVAITTVPQHPERDCNVLISMRV